MRLILILIFGMLVFCAVGCGGGSAGSPAKETVVASFYPLAYAAEEVGNGGVDVENLTPPGAEPHDLEVSPQDVAAIREADLVLLLGDGFQPQLEDAAGTGRKVLRLLDTPGLALRPDGDPHVWLDLLRYAKIVGRTGLAHCERHEIVTSHEAFGYLAERYDLEQVAITGLSPEVEPEPAKLQQVIELVRERGVTTIYFETLVSPRIAETVARETGAKTAVLNPIEGLTKNEISQGENYFSLMRTNLRTLREGLGCS